MSPSASVPRMASVSACSADVRVGMADQRSVVRNPNATERDVIANIRTLPECMHVDAGAHAHVAERRKLRSFGAGEIALIGDFDVAGLAGKHADLQARPFGECGVVGEVVAALRGGAAVRLEQSGEREALRRLHQAQRIAVERLMHMALCIDDLDRIGHRQCRDRSAAYLGCRYGARDQRTRREGSRRVVNQNEVWLARRERLQSGAYGTLPRRPAEDWGERIEVGCGDLESRYVVAMNDRLDEGDLRMLQQGDQALPDHRRATDRPELLGHIAARPRPPSGGDNDGRDTRHAVSAPCLCAWL